MIEDAELLKGLFILHNVFHLEDIYIIIGRTIQKWHIHLGDNSVNISNYSLVLLFAVSGPVLFRVIISVCVASHRGRDTEKGQR